MEAGKCSLSTEDSGGGQTPSLMNNEIHCFEDLAVWQEGMQLAVQIHEIVAGWRDYGLKDQMQRAAVSVPSNISEGYERGSNREFVQFLHYAKGSAGELRTQVCLATMLGYCSESASQLLLEKSRKVSAMLYKYIQVRKRDF